MFPARTRCHATLPHQLGMAPHWCRVATDGSLSLVTCDHPYVRGRWGRRTSYRTGGPVSARGVLYVHSAQPALCPHIEWAVAGVLGVPVDLTWTPQPAAPGTLRAQAEWEGRPGTAAAITSSLMGWQRIRFEITEDASPGVDG